MTVDGTDGEGRKKRRRRLALLPRSGSRATLGRFRSAPSACLGSQHVGTFACPNHKLYMVLQFLSYVAIGLVGCITYDPADSE